MMNCETIDYNVDDDIGIGSELRSRVDKHSVGGNAIEVQRASD